MKYLIITNHSYMLWQFRRELISELMKQGEVVLSMPFVGHEKDFQTMQCRCVETAVDRRGINLRADVKLFASYWRLLKEEKPDMVITYSIKPNIYAGFACQLLRIPYCTNVQGLGTAFQKQPLASVVTILYKVALRRARIVFFENQPNAEEFVRRRITPRSRQQLLSGAGVNLEVFQYRDYPSEEGGIHYLYLGRIMKEKGVDELFEAARRMKRAYGSRVVFDLVGFFEEEYREKVDQLVADGVVRFYGFQEDPKPFYAMSHCVVVPSYHEGMSNVLLEAASTGRALITTDIPGCREAVEKRVNGLLCKKQDTDSLYACMEQFLKLDEASRRQMGMESRRKMEAEFDRRSTVKHTVQLITE